MRLPFCIVLLTFVTGPALAQMKTDTDLEKLRSNPAPRQQSDIDTLSLASAHRERAESMQQRTDGLWQSWLVSICEGCNPNQRRPAEIGAAADAYKPAYKISDSGKSGTPSATNASRSLQGTGIGRSATLSGDLSDQNVRQIRSMPNR